MSNIQKFKEAWKKPRVASEGTLMKNRVVPPNGPEALLKKAAESPVRPTSGKASKEILILKATLCVPSAIPDRMAVEHDTELENLVESIKNDGQKVPILVRPHPEHTGFFEIAYGRRRWQACQQLGIGVLAIVDEKLTGEELVVAQGKENHERKNLSFIETALFASKLLLIHQRATVTAALGASSRSVITQYTKVAREVPEALILAIGPAPKVGRPKWTDLAELFISGRLQSGPFLKLMNSVQNSSVWEKADSNERFNIVLKTAQNKDKRSLAQSVVKFSSTEGSVLLELSKGKSISKFTIKGLQATEFVEFLEGQMKELIQQFEEKGNFDAE